MLQKMKEPCGPCDERSPDIIASSDNGEPRCYGGPHFAEYILHVVVPINNYVQYKRRYELLEKFLQHMATLPGIIVYIVEVALHERPFVCTEANNPRHLQLRTNSVMWHKENMINLMVEKLPRNWKYVAWVDGDIEFQNKHIAHDTIHQLQTHDIVQMFQSVVNQGPDGQVVSTFNGFCYEYAKRGFSLDSDFRKYSHFHPGFCYAATRKGWNAMGGLIDFAILGSADHSMVLGLIGQIDQSRPGNVSDAYKRRLKEWENRVERGIQRNIGFVKGTIMHGWHGRFADRKYVERWSIIVENGYNPDTDIMRDWQGLYAFDEPKPRLRDQLRHYFLQRNEDTIDF
jgi:hypothetical protein